MVHKCYSLAYRLLFLFVWGTRKKAVGTRLNSPGNLLRWPGKRNLTFQRRRTKWDCDTPFRGDYHDCSKYLLKTHTLNCTVNTDDSNTFIKGIKEPEKPTYVVSVFFLALFVACIKRKRRREDSTALRFSLVIRLP